MVNFLVFFPKHIGLIAFLVFYEEHIDLNFPWPAVIQAANTVSFFLYTQ